MVFIKFDYRLIKLKNIVLETVNNIIFQFNSYFVLTAQTWHILFFSLILFTFIIYSRRKIRIKIMGHWNTECPKHFSYSKTKGKLTILYYLIEFSTNISLYLFKRCDILLIFHHNNISLISMIEFHIQFYKNYTITTIY